MSDTTKLGRSSDNNSTQPVVAIEATQRAGASGSYATPKQGYQALTMHSSRLDQAVNFYLHTASLEADTGELIGVDTYA